MAVPPDHPPGTCRTCDWNRRDDRPTSMPVPVKEWKALPVEEAFVDATIEVDAQGRLWGGPFKTDLINYPVCCQLDRLHRFHDHAEEKNMDRLEVIEARMAELEAQAAALRAIPDPAEYEDETVISFEKSYSDGSGKWYVYVAVKKDGQWFITGQVTTHRYTDDELRVKLAQDSVRNIFRASSWEAVAKVVSTDSAPVTE